jgi:hypothetical protein
VRKEEKSPRVENPKYFVLVSGVHEKCGTRIDAADPDITTKRALIRWVRAFTNTGKLTLPVLVCGNCRTHVQPTHLLVGEVLPFKVRAIVSLTEIDRFDPSDWPDLPS